MFGPMNPPPVYKRIDTEWPADVSPMRQIDMALQGILTVNDYAINQLPKDPDWELGNPVTKRMSIEVRVPLSDEHLQQILRALNPHTFQVR